MPLTLTISRGVAMSGKISGLVLFVVALAAMLADAQVVALIAAIAGLLFLFYSSRTTARGSRRDSTGVWVGGGTNHGSDSSQCDSTGSSGDCGGGDGGGGGD